MDYVWYAHESMHSWVCVCMCVRCVWLHSVCLGGQAEWGVYTSMHACVYASMQRPLPSLSLPPSLSIYHASIGLSASGMRCGERGRGEGYMGRNRNKFSPPILKMHIHFHTLKRQWGAHTLAALSPICDPPHPTPHTQQNTKYSKDECVCPIQRERVKIYPLPYLSS